MASPSQSLLSLTIVSILLTATSFVPSADRAGGPSSQALFVDGAVDSKSHLVKITTTIMIENDGNAPITHYHIDCDERNGHSRLSHIIAKLQNTSMPVTKTDDGKLWHIDLSSKPIEPNVATPLMVTKVYTHLELIPSHDVYLMPFSSIQYQARVIKQGRPQKIKVPTEQYYLFVDNRDLVDLVTSEESTSTVLALESEGSTRIRFIDKSVIADEDFIQPASNIHIVNPSYLTMHITPGDSWALQQFTDYTVEIRVYDAQQHQIYPSDNLNIQLNLGTESLLITNSTANGTLNVIHTLKPGPSRLIARLLGTTPSLYTFGRPDQEIELIQELSIYEPLHVKPRAIVLPWMPEINPSYQISIFAAGGTGSYLWTTNNSDLTEIMYDNDDTSVARITTNGEGISFVQCYDTKSSVFTGHSMVVVSRIVELSILPSITETEVGNDLLLPVAVYANKTSLLESQLPDEDGSSSTVLFHDCSKIKFGVEIVEKTRFSCDPTEVHPNTRQKACASLRFTCNEPGSSRVWISYTDPTDPFSRPIRTTTVIACHKPLKPVYPEEVGVVARHTSIEIAFEGGPRPFGSRLEDHYTNLDPVGDTSVLSLEPIVDKYRFNKDLHVFRAYCNDYGEVTLTLSVGNQPSATLPNPASSQASMKIACAKPDSIQLRPRLKDLCPLNELTVTPISTVTPTDFELLVFDDARRQFLNISSFSIQWSLQGPGQVARNPRQVEETNAVAGFRRVTRNYVTVKPQGEEGYGRIQADLQAYKKHGLIRSQTLDLSASLDIQFVDFAQIQPNRTVVYNHYKNIVALSIIKGSGYFSVESLQGAKHANVTYVNALGRHRINIVPLSVGRFSIRLDDQCIDSDSGLSVLSEVAIVNRADFSREALRPGRSMHQCDDIDPSMFCLYLSVDRQKSTPTIPPSSRRPSPTAVQTAPTTPLPTKEAPSVTELKPTTFNPPAVIEKLVSEPQKERSSNPPDVTFEVTMLPAVAHAAGRVEPEGVEGGILQTILGYFVMVVVTASAVTLAFKWWKEQHKPPPAQRFVTDSSMLRHSPGGPGGAAGHSGRVSFTPPSSRDAPQSSTPRTRPLYTERFSTTLLSNN